MRGGHFQKLPVNEQLTSSTTLTIDHFRPTAWHIFINQEPGKLYAEKHLLIPLGTEKNISVSFIYNFLNEFMIIITQTLFLENECSIVRDKLAAYEIP